MKQERIYSIRLLRDTESVYPMVHKQAAYDRNHSGRNPDRGGRRICGACEKEYQKTEKTGAGTGKDMITERKSSMLNLS